MTGRVTHGATRGRGTTPEFRSWLAMRQRCYYEGGEKYPDYGGRGITVCDRWRDSFENFLSDMGPRPAGTTLDRIDGEGNYEPENCRWATPEEQSRNRRRPGPKAACPAGHKYEGDNVRIKRDGSQACRTCDRERARERRANAKP